MSKKQVEIVVSEEELRYLIACGAALAQNVPPNSLATYCGFNKNQIIEITKKFRKIADDNGIDM